MSPTATSLPTTPLAPAPAPGHGPAAPGEAAAPGGRPWPLSLAGRLGVLTGLLVALLVISAVAALGPLRQARRDMDAVLSHEVRYSQQARDLQVEFERQGRAWHDILLQGANPTARAVDVQRFQDRSAAVTTLATKLQAQVADPAAVAELVAFHNEYQAMNEAYEDALATFIAGGGRDPSAAEAATADRDQGPAKRLDTLVDRLDGATTAARAAQRAEFAQQRSVLLALGALVVLTVLGMAAVIVLGIVRPIRRFVREADHAAREAVPQAVARVRALPADAPPPVLAPLHAGTGDELEDLGRALSALQQVAVDLAVHRRRADQEAAQTLINLGRRNQYLVDRARACLGQLDGLREDPVAAVPLGQLDCTTSRMRRSAESMLVFAGAPTQRRIAARPVPVADIVRAALAEVEDGERVDLHHVEEAAVVGAAVPDLTHLVAELLENATNFSPPDVRVTVVGRFGSAGRYGLHVVDGGIGMSASELAEANARIAQAAGIANPDTHRLGLHVVGRLAARIAVQVTLRPSTDRGVTAQVDLPPTVVLDIERTVAEQDSRTPPRGAARAGARRAPAEPATGRVDGGTER